jgi:hypothetical protein
MSTVDSPWPANRGNVPDVPGQEVAAVRVGHDIDHLRQVDEHQHPSYTRMLYADRSPYAIWQRARTVNAVTNWSQRLSYDDVVGVDRNNVGLLRPWRIAGAPGWYLQIVSNGVPHAMAAGATVDTVKADPDLSLDVGRIFVPPGVHTVTGASNALWESAPVTVLVLLNRGRGRRRAIDIAPVRARGHGTERSRRGAFRPYSAAASHGRAHDRTRPPGWANRRSVQRGGPQRDRPDSMRKT